MIDATFDAVAENIAARVSRRGSLLALGGVSLASLVGPARTAAKKKKKSSKKRNKQLANRKCQQQVEPCQTALAQVGAPQLAFCCQFLEDCDSSSFLTCLAA
jgi:hypothetical protein